VANTRATIEAYDKNRKKETSRLGSEQAWVQAATWHTFATATVEKDGSGYVQVKRDGQIIHRFEFESENLSDNLPAVDS
jgi:hypothetical protein